MSSSLPSFRGELLSGLRVGAGDYIFIDGAQHVRNGGTLFRARNANVITTEQPIHDSAWRAVVCLRDGVDLKTNRFAEEPFLSMCRSSRGKAVHHIPRGSVLRAQRVLAGENRRVGIMKY